MKILAIRGRNLTSLAGAFAVDFTAPPLDRAGLFAIVGPTGAGKSTLLDALCLALFDRVPRLGDRGGALIGGAEVPEKERLAANDVRHLLRKGASTGMAEVEFEGRDGRPYRAHWEARRARLRADGRLQAQALTLTDLSTGTTLGGTKTETLAEIEKRLGLSFDQFRRSALLAQGDFAAFLRAEAKERAELLERMTGTEIYGRLSVAAYERAAEGRQRIVALDAQRGQVQLLDPEARNALDGRITAAGAALTAAKNRLAQAEASGQWFKTLAALRAEESTAASEVERARRQQEDAAGLREDLVRTEQAQVLRGVVQRADAAAAAVVQAEIGFAAATLKAQHATEAEKQAWSRSEAARAAAEEAVRARREAEPGLAQARDLDRTIAAQAAEWEKAAGQASSAEKSAATAATERDRQEAAAALAERERDRARAWLEERPELVTLAAEWPRWRVEIERFGSAAGEEDRHRASLLTLDDRQRELAARLAALDEECRRLRAALELAEAAWIAARDQAAARPLEEAREAQERARKARDALQDLSSAAERAHGAQEAEKTAVAREQEALTGAATAGRESARHGAARAEAARQRDEREQELARLRLVLGLEDHRSRLKPGEPCPLCGATEHPFARGDAVPTAEEARLEAEVARLRAVVEEAAAQEAALATEALNRRQAAAEAARLAQDQRALLEGWLRDWPPIREAHADVDSPPDPLAPGVVQELSRKLAKVKASLADLGERVKQAQRLDREEQDLRLRRETATKDHDARQAERRKAHEALQELEPGLAAERTAAAVAERHKNDSLGRLRAVFSWRSGWEAEIAKDPAGFLVTWEVQVTEAQVVQEREKLADGKLREIDRPLALVREQTQASQADAAAKAALRDTLEANLISLRQQRSPLLGGASADDVQAGLERSVAEAVAARDRTLQAHADARVEAARASQGLDGATRAAAVAREESAAAKAALDAQLAARGFTEPDLRTLLGRDVAWLEEHRRQAKALEDGVLQAETRLATVRGQREAHERNGAPSIPEAEAEAVRQAAESEVSEGERRARELDRELTRDDDARQRLADLLARVEAEQRQSEVWRQLTELIGSADGKKFRTFAQSLTLDLLLDLANERLAELVPRYRLARVPGTDLDLQVVDQDLGEAVRSVNSLSGGETFLVSLGLALGLSSLAGRDTRIESLFIDEGFGSLDADTLDQALAVLDALQASGCKVGIISHVPGLAERIGVQVQVVPRGAGRSEVRVAGA